MTTATYSYEAEECLRKLMLKHGVLRMTIQFTPVKPVEWIDIQTTVMSRAIADEMDKLVLKTLTQSVPNV